MHLKLKVRAFIKVKTGKMYMYMYINTAYLEHCKRMIGKISRTSTSIYFFLLYLNPLQLIQQPIEPHLQNSNTHSFKNNKLSKQLQ